MTPLTQPTTDLIDRIAGRVSRLGLGPLAVFLLELQKPLSFAGSQVVLLGQPLLDVFLPAGVVPELAAVLADRDQLDRLITRIETLSRRPSRPEGG